MRRSRVWENLPLGMKGLVVVAIPLVSLIAATGLSYLVTQQRSQPELYVASYLQKVHTDVQRILFLVQDAETGVRSYILTGEPPFLRRYHTAQQQLPSLLRSLDARRRELSDDSLGFDDPAASGAGDLLRKIPTLNSLSPDLVTIARLIPDRLVVLSDLVAYGEAKAEGTAPSIPVDLTDMLTGRVPIVQTLNHTSKHIQPQLLLLADRAAKDQAVRRSEQVRVIVLVALLGLIGGIAAVVIFTRTITRRVALLESGAAAMAAGS
ncbi:MAG: hypothetical protein QOH90_1790, partial [Actinomycetota bacterium]|nr:hypothetical protein [Actinomycetota bacterium]